ncbi:MAG: hypothetical protein PHF56_07065 [Desulfuromonadaceae bacterium]|nr:hypothetical protein [Desulfuromonadaceae bacterium]
MTKSVRKQLMAYLLLVVVLLLPINSFAHDMTSGASKDKCACQLMLPDVSTDGSGDPSNKYPVNNPDDCCDSEECCPDAADPPIFSVVGVNISGKHLFHPHTNAYIPVVYLAIFVPPES